MSRDRLYAQGAAVALLLLLAALAVAFSLLEAQWGPGLGMLPWLVAGSVLLTLLLVRSAAPPWLLHLLSLAVGLALTIYLAGRFALPGLEAGDATRLLSHRLALWASAIRQGVPADDLLPFSVLLGLCLWLTFHYSAWLIYRSGRVWWAVVGPAIALLVNTYYAPHINTVYVGFYAFCALLLVMRVSLQGLTQDWRLARIPHDRTLGEDFLVDAACMVAVVLTLSWVLPPLTLEQGAAEMWVRFERPWRGFQKHWTELFPMVATAPQGPQISVHGESLALGGPVNLADIPLFQVRMSEPSRLQGMVYDLYDGRQWWASASAIALLEPADYPTTSAYRDRHVVEQTVTVLREARALVAAPSPLWFSLPVKSEHIKFSAERGLSALDIYAATSRRTLAPGETYQALSLSSNASEGMLRGSGKGYPDWLPQVYFAVPPSLPKRVADLAREIAGDEATPYAMAAALESYLRELRYNPNVKAPPGGRDAVDYFLFDSREGYCNYFASSMALMARSFGIPARVVAGYTIGPYDAGTGAYVVKGTNAHSWPQLYFPGYGWLDFEPTPSQPRIMRALPEMEETQSRQPAPTPERDPLADERDDDSQLNPGARGPLDFLSLAGLRLLGWLPILAVLSLAGGTSVLFAWVLPRRKWGLAERTYADLVLLARLLSVRPRACDTPLEYGRRIGAALPEVSGEVDSIVAAFSQARYRRSEADEAGSEALRQSWERVTQAARRAAPRVLLSRAGL